MASKYWIKLYHEILDDPKMGVMSHELWRHTIELFLVAGEYDQDGLLPPIDQVAWKLRLSNERCNETLQELLQIGIISVTDQGNYVVKNFAKRQKAADGAERVRQYRRRNPPEKAKKDDFRGKQPVTDEKRNGNEDVTKRYPDTDNRYIPKGSEKISQPRNSKKVDQPETVGPKTVVRNKFFELTQLPEPPKKTMGTWWGWFAELLTIGQSDPTKTCRIMETVIVYMRDEGLAISSPKSLINLARTVASGQNLNGATEITRPGPQPSAPIDLEKLKKLQQGLL